MQKDSKHLTNVPFIDNPKKDLVYIRCLLIMFLIFLDFNHKINHNRYPNITTEALTSPGTNYYLQGYYYNFAHFPPVFHKSLVLRIVIPVAVLA